MATVTKTRTASKPTQPEDPWLEPPSYVVPASSLVFGARLRLALLMMVVGPLVIHLVFYKLLRVPLPPGLVPVPW